MQENPPWREIRGESHSLRVENGLTQRRCTSQVNLNRTIRSIDSLGGGRFLEAGRTEEAVSSWWSTLETSI